MAETSDTKRRPLPEKPPADLPALFQALARPLAAYLAQEDDLAAAWQLHDMQQLARQGDDALAWQQLLTLLGQTASVRLEVYPA